MPIISGGSSSGGGIVTKVFDTTLGADTASIDTGANGIPQTGNVLELWVIGRTDEATNFSSAIMRINGDTGANYDTQDVQGLNTGTNAAVTLAATSWNQQVLPGASDAAGTFGVFQITIPAYTQTTARKVAAMTQGVVDTTAANCYARAQVCNWRSTAAINQISVAAPGAQKLKAGSRMVIYIR